MQPRFPRRPGISKAFQTALLGRDDTVIQTLVSYNAKAERVSLRKLVDSLRKTTSHGDGTGDKVHVWGASFTWSGIRGARLQRLTDLYASSHLMRSRVNPGGALLRSDSGTHALLELLPGFVREWYGLYIARGRKRWSTAEIVELNATPRGGSDSDRASTDRLSGSGSGGTVPVESGVGVYPQLDDVKTNWTDLFFWAVLADERTIAQNLWVKTSEPMRFAIWAAHVAHVISNEQLNVTKKVPSRACTRFADALCRCALQMRFADALCRCLKSLPHVLPSTRFFHTRPRPHASAAFHTLSGDVGGGR